MNCPRCQSLLPEGAVYCPKCGMMSAPTPSPQTLSGQETIVRPLVPHGTSRLEAGAVFANRYEVLTRLGEGGMGIVYAAKDKTSGLELVLKLIHPDLVQGESAVRRLMSEGLTAREIRHPNVVAVYDVSQWEGQPYFTMEYVRGRSLRSWLVEQLNRDTDVPLNLAIGVVKSILLGLSEAHRMGIVHRDLKPENILLKGEPGSAGAQVKIVDFGIAKAVGTTRTSKTSFGGGGGAGTPLYMAPEQMTSSEGVRPSANLYSLSVMLYEMLMDALPQTRFEAVSKHRKDVPATIDELIEKGLSVRPRSRYQTAAEYADALDRAVQVPQVPLVPEVPVVPPAPPTAPPVPVPPIELKPPVPAPSPEPLPEPPVPDPVVPPIAVTPFWGRTWVQVTLALVVFPAALVVAAGVLYGLVGPSEIMDTLILGLSALFLVGWVVSRRRLRPGLRPETVESGRPQLSALVVGAGAGFIGALAGGLMELTATATKRWRLIPDELIPGTICVGYAIPMVLSRLLNKPYFPGDIQLTSLAAAAAGGAWLGPSILARVSTRKIQLTIGLGLFLPLIAAVLGPMIPDQYLGYRGLSWEIVPAGAPLTAAAGVLAAFGVNPFLTGRLSLTTIGIDFRTAGAIAAVVSAIVLPMAAAGFIRTGRYAMRPALGLNFGGVIGVTLAYLFVHTLGFESAVYQLARWGIVGIAIVGAVLFLRPAPKRS